MFGIRLTRAFILDISNLEVVNSRLVTKNDFHWCWHGLVVPTNKPFQTIEADELDLCSVDIVFVLPDMSAKVLKDVDNHYLSAGNGFSGILFVRSHVEGVQGRDVLC
jgi:hypothetical protein